MAVRWLEKDEKAEASKVFRDSLDSSKVIIDSGLGFGNKPWVSNDNGRQRVHVGSSFFGTLGGLAWASKTDSAKVSGMTVRAWYGMKLKGEDETDAKGRYYIGKLIPGAYRVEFFSDSYKPVISVPTELRAGEYRQVDCVAGQYVTWRGWANVSTRDFNVLMHELTHAWQNQHGVDLFLSGLGCQIENVVTGDAYSFGPGEPWGDYSIEQQASLVAWWYGLGAHEYGTKYWPYIRDYVRKGKIK
jgi:hypothetical protein